MLFTVMKTQRWNVLSTNGSEYEHMNSTIVNLEYVIMRLVDFNGIEEYCCLCLWKEKKMNLVHVHFNFAKYSINVIYLLGCDAISITFSLFIFTRSTHSPFSVRKIHSKRVEISRQKLSVCMLAAPIFLISHAVCQIWHPRIFLYVIIISSYLKPFFFFLFFFFCLVLFT